MRAAALAAAVALAAIVAWFGGPALLEAWLPAFLLWIGLAVGALGVLMMGHLLGEAWADEMRPVLAAAARSLPVLAPLAVPVLLGLDRLYPWAVAGAAADLPAPRAAWFDPGFVRLRAMVYLALWAGVALVVTRPAGRGRLPSAIGLILLVPSASLAAQDWILSRDPAWFGGVFGLTVLAGQMVAALAAAVLVTLRGGLAPLDREAMRGLERGLVSLALALLWLWFMGFITVWMANIPAEAGWYVRRLDGGWGLLKLGLVLPALVAAIAVGAIPRQSPRRMEVVCALLLVQHPAEMLWLVRPDAPGPAPSPLLDAGVLAAVSLVWSGWWWAELRRGPAARAGEPAPAPPR